MAVGAFVVKLVMILKTLFFSLHQNTAEIAFYGLIKGAEDYLNKTKLERIRCEKILDEEKPTATIEPQSETENKAN